MSGFPLTDITTRPRAPYRFRGRSSRDRSRGTRTGTPLRDRIAVAAALAAPPAVAGLLIPFRTDLASANMALLLVVVVVAVAANGHRLAGALAALSSARWFSFFLTQPYDRFAVADRDDVTTAVLLLAVGLVVSQLAARARTLKVVAITDAAHLARLHETAQLAQSTKSAEAVVDHVRHQLTGLLDLEGCRFEHGTLLGRPPRIEQDGEVVVGGVLKWDVERRGWPQEEIELRAFGNGRYCGRFMLRPAPGATATLQARLVAVTLADQVGSALANPEAVRSG